MVTPDEVKGITGTDIDIDRIQPHVGAARIVVAETIEKDSRYGESLVHELELRLAAHLVLSALDPTVSKETIGIDSDVEYAAPMGQGLDSTPFGQQIRTLDIFGVLVSALAGSSRVSATIKAIG